MSRHMAGQESGPGMAAKHLHFEKAFLLRAQARTGENALPQILRDADLKPAGQAREVGLPGAALRFLPPRIMRRRKKTEW